MQALELNANAHKGYVTVRVPFQEKEVKVIVIWDAENEKNYDLQLLKNIVQKSLNTLDSKKSVDPLEWQKQIRNEWE